MPTSRAGIHAGFARTPGSAWQAARTARWYERREAALNWLALGVLLAAWNASENDAPHSMRRPHALRGYASVSVRAAAIHLDPRPVVGAETIGEAGVAASLTLP